MAPSSATSARAAARSRSSSTSISSPSWPSAAQGVMPWSRAASRVSRMRTIAQPSLIEVAACSASGTPRPPARFIATRSRKELTTCRKSRRRSSASLLSCSPGHQRPERGAEHRQPQRDHGRAEHPGDQRERQHDERHEHADQRRQQRPGQEGLDRDWPTMPRLAVIEDERFDAARGEQVAEARADLAQPHRLVAVPAVRGEAGGARTALAARVDLRQAGRPADRAAVEHGDEQQHPEPRPRRPRASPGRGCSCGVLAAVRAERAASWGAHGAVLKCRKRSGVSNRDSRRSHMKPAANTPITISSTTWPTGEA